MTDLGDKIYSVAQIRQLEKKAVEVAGISSQNLMESAAKFCLQMLKHQWPNEKSLTIYAGNGNNGGDGLYLGLFAKEAGYQVEVVRLVSHAEKKESPATYLNAILVKLSQVGIEPVVFTSEFMPSGQILVDALLGIGLQGTLKPEYDDVISHINFYREHYRKVLAIDIPSGLEADTGCIGEKVVYADMTASFIGYKPGLLTGAGLEVSGEIYIDKLEISEFIFDQVRPFCHKITRDLVKSYLPIRFKLAHKYNFGHVVVIGGGERHFAGATVLSASAALKIGAGLVSIIVPSTSYMRISHAPAELMCYAIDNFNYDTVGFLDKADVIVIGPGLGQNAWSKQALAYILSLKNKKILYDADALNVIAKDDLGAAMFWADEHSTIFTPHSGEAARLLKVTSVDIQADRFLACKKIATQYHATTVLKGAGSVVYNQDNQFSLCGVANSALATAGTGDVLTGMIAGLWAQGLTAHHAATAGVWLHANNCTERGLVASDIIQAIPVGLKACMM